MGRPQCGRGATPGPLAEPGGGHEPCSPGQRGPLLRGGHPAITASAVRPGGSPGAPRAARLCQPSCAGTIRTRGSCVRGACVPAGGTGPATGERSLALRRRRGFVQRVRLRGQARYPGRPAVGPGAETAGRGLVAVAVPFAAEDVQFTDRPLVASVTTVFPAVPVTAPPGLTVQLATASRRGRQADHRCRGRTHYQSPSSTLENRPRFPAGRLMPDSDQAAVSAAHHAPRVAVTAHAGPKVLVRRLRDHTREYDWPGIAADEQVRTLGTAL